MQYVPFEEFIMPSHLQEPVVLTKDGVEYAAIMSVLDYKNLLAEKAALDLIKQQQYDWLQQKLEKSENDVKEGRVYSATEMEADYEARWGIKFE